MADYYLVAVEGMQKLSDIGEIPEKMLSAARMAINKTAPHMRTKSAKYMESQIDFPAGYLIGKSNPRLDITKLASNKDLTAVIEGRDRPTSLARFVVGGARAPGKGAPRAAGLNVVVKRGVVKEMKGAFIMQLKSGNLGLAVRTKTPPSRGAKAIGKGVYLLYGPSVDQVFTRARDVVRPDGEDFLEREFNRLLELEL